MAQRNRDDSSDDGGAPYDARDYGHGDTFEHSRDANALSYFNLAFAEGFGVHHKEYIPNNQDDSYLQGSCTNFKQFPEFDQTYANIHGSTCQITCALEPRRVTGGNSAFM